MNRLRVLVIQLWRVIMGQTQSKDELLYQQVNYANVEGIKALRNEGAGLEWVDRDGKTPLIVACMNPDFITVATTLIELGANVNAYRPGSHAGTPLHHAAKRGLDQIVKLLLSHRANPMVMNDDCQTPLDVARAKGFCNVVRAIESHICLFSGFLRVLYGPGGFLEAFTSQWLSSKILAVVLPRGTRDYTKHGKLELAIYNTAQDGTPSAVIALWKATVEEPQFNQSDPSLVIFDKTTKKKYKLASATVGDKQQHKRFLSACRGIPQVMHPPQPNNFIASVPPATAPISEDIELAMAINASIQSAMVERPPLLPDTQLSSGGSTSSSLGNIGDNPSYNGWDSGGLPASIPPPKVNSSGWLDKTPEDSYNGWSLVSETGSSSSSNPAENNLPCTVATTQEIPATASNPSAPPIPIHYPSIDASPIDISTPTITEHKTAKISATDGDDSGSSSSCIICFDAPVEGACIPCGHMAGCVSCLNGIKAKNWGCPVCRSKIDQVIRLYSV